MAMNAQGTKVYFIDKSVPEVVSVGCAISIGGLDAPRDQREVTCLEDPVRKYEAGMKTPATMTIGLNFDSSDPSHVKMKEKYDAEETLEWAIGMSDGVADPALDLNDNFDLPDSRTWLRYDGYISAFPFEFAIAASVVSTLSVQMSDDLVLVPKVIP